jgi:hypothetical protein
MFFKKEKYGSQIEKKIEKSKILFDLRAKEDLFQSWKTFQELRKSIFNPLRENAEYYLLINNDNAMLLQGYYNNLKIFKGLNLVIEETSTSGVIDSIGAVDYLIQLSFLDETKPKNFNPIYANSLAVRLISYVMFGKRHYEIHWNNELYSELPKYKPEHTAIGHIGNEQIMHLAQGLSCMMSRVEQLKLKALPSENSRGKETNLFMKIPY